MSTLEEVARRIGAASSNPDWQFAAKHWDRVDDPTSKAQLMKLAQAAREGEGGGTVAGGVLQRPYESWKVGSWYRRSGELICQLVHIAPDGRKASLLWFKTPAGSYHTLNAWPLTDLGGLTPIDPPIFLTPAQDDL